MERSASPVSHTHLQSHRANQFFRTIQIACVAYCRIRDCLRQALVVFGAQKLSRFALLNSISRNFMIRQMCARNFRNTLMTFKTF